MLRKLCLYSSSRCIRTVLFRAPRSPNTKYSVHQSTLRLSPYHCEVTCSHFALNSVRHFNVSSSCALDKFDFEAKCEETLDSLAEYFEDLIERVDHLDKADVNYSDGVLTVQFGEPYGTYVINRQSPNSQIWLSSPTSGPKRFDCINGSWIYAHDGISLHNLLDMEISKIAQTEAKFSELAYKNRTS